MSEIRVDKISEKTADAGITLKSQGTADNKPMVLTLQTAETDMAANDVIGKIAFQAPDEGTGTDAILVAAAIQARSEGDFSSSANATAIDFMVGASEAAATKMSLSSGGVLTAVELDISGNIDVDGTTNLDVVDIDGAVNMATTALVTGVLTTTAATVFNGGFASNAASSIGGTTPTLTIGDGGAEDAKILFDGNAQNFYIGLDDSTDDLVIGLGNTLGTTPAITIDENTNIFIPDSSLTIIGSGNYDILTVKSTDADANVGPVMLFNRDSANPANDDFLGAIDFQGDNNAGEAHDYIRILSRISDITNGSEKATLIIKDATGNNFINYAHDVVIFNDDSVDRDFRVESNGQANMLFVNGGTDRVGIRTNAPDMLLDVNGTVTAGGGSDEKLQQWNIGSDNVKAEIEYLDASANRGYAIGTSSQHDFMLRTDDTIRLKVEYSGKVGVGAATNLAAGDSDNSIFQVGGTTNNVYAAHIFHTGDVSNAAPFGLQITYTAGSPDSNSDTANLFIRCNDTTTARFQVAGDGDVTNHDNSFGAISDQRLKDDIADASSQWDDIKAIKVRKFERKDDITQHGRGTHVQIGVIAQELEAAGMNGLVNHSDPEAEHIVMSSEFGTLYEDGDDIPEGKAIGDIKNTTSEKVRSVKYSVLHMKAIKALQEAQTRIETLETKVAALEG